MDVILICIVLALALFISAYITKRRFGLLGLALATGSILSGIWGYNAGLVASCFGVPSSPLTSAVLLALIILLPAGILLFHGYTYKTLVGQVIGASLFTMLALAFLVEPLGHVLILHGYSANVYDWLLNNRTLIIGAGLSIAVVDLFLTKPAHLSDKRHTR
jgi:hypothetical protein